MSDAWVPLPTNLEDTYPSRGTSDTLHLRHHDAIHYAVNTILSASPSIPGLAPAPSGQTYMVVIDDQGVLSTQPIE